MDDDSRKLYISEDKLDIKTEEVEIKEEGIECYERNLSKDYVYYNGEFNPELQNLEVKDEMTLPPSTSGVSNTPKQRKDLTPKEMLEVLDEYEFDSNSDIVGEYHSGIESDSESELVDSLVTTSGDSSQVEWKETEKFRPFHYKFDASQSGINDECNFTDSSTPYDYFKFFCSNEVIDLVVTETNNYYSYSKEKKLFSPKYRAQSFQEVTSDDMHVFLALTMLMAHTKKRRLEDYWSTDVLIETLVFGKYMPRNKYQGILSLLHFCYENDPIDSEDHLRKCRPILNLFQSAFRKCLKPFQKLIIDESLVLFKGRLVFKQYIPSKRDHFSLKLFVICDCKTGVVLDIIVYTGNRFEVDAKDPLGLSGAVVKKLLSPYLGKWHILYTNNWYTSPGLSLFLHQQNTGSCGTVRSNRKKFPKFVDDPSKKLQCLASQPLLAAKFKDKRDIYLLTTVHEGKMINSKKIDYRTDLPIQKPDIIIDYNKNMQLVDKSDMQINTIDCLRRTLKWYKTLFFHCLDIAVLNSHHLYTLKKKTNMTLREFSMCVIREILEKHGEITKLIPRKSLANAPDRLIAANYISRHHLATIGRDKNQKLIQRDCHVCKNSKHSTSKKRTSVTLWCRECRIPLCIKCFVDYHTLADY